MMNHNIICLIADKLNFIDRQRLKHVCRGFYQLIKIKVIPIQYCLKLTNSILRLYRDLEELDIPYEYASPILKTRLMYCDERYVSKISQSGIKYCTKLKRLNAAFNYRIKSVNHMKELRELNASYNCGINDEGIKECLQLEKLDCTYNPKINSVNHLTLLKCLSANGSTSRISDASIEECNQLIKLSAVDNVKISLKKLIEIEDKNYIRNN